MVMKHQAAQGRIQGNGRYGNAGRQGAGGHNPGHGKGKMIARHL